MIKVVKILIGISLLLIIVIVYLCYKLKKVQKNYNTLKKDYSNTKKSNDFKQREIDRMSNQIKIYEKKEEEYEKD